MFVICLFFLRELSPGIRSQRMTAMNERALVEAQAEGLDLQQLTKNRWRQMLHVSTVLSPIAINLFLIIYFTAIAYFVLPAGLPRLLAEQLQRDPGDLLGREHRRAAGVGFISDKTRTLPATDFASAPSAWRRPPA